jgi:glutathione peroxidase-family protein
MGSTSGKEILDAKFTKDSSIFDYSVVAANKDIFNLSELKNFKATLIVNVASK